MDIRLTRLRWGVGTAVAALLTGGTATGGASVALATPEDDHDRQPTGLGAGSPRDSAFEIIEAGRARSVEVNRRNSAGS